MNELIDPNMYYGDREHFFFLERTITEKDVRDFANVIGDLNPIHFDEEYAKTARFSKPIVHGEFLAGLVSSVLGNKNPGNGTILLQNKMRFVGPVYVGQKV